MIKKITVTNYLGESLVLDLFNPYLIGMYILEITGLGPPETTINTTEIATSDGAIYNSSRSMMRNIVLSIGFLFEPTIEDVRHRSYKYFPTKKKVKLTFETDKRTCWINGYVESNTPNIFSKTETTQVSVICPDPYFYSLEKTTTLFSGVVPKFEFPFSNESLTEDLIIMGEIRNDTNQTVFYEGDSEVGVLISIYALGEVSKLKIFSTNDISQKMEIDTDKLTSITGKPISQGDKIIISTVKGSKYINLVRDGVVINILNCLNRSPYWFQLVKGDNLFSYTAEYGSSNLEFRIEHNTVYEGV